LFFALVANDRPSFDKILRWTENNLCAGDMTARLPAWKWGRRDDNTWGVLDDNSASDADLWMAYTLAEAGRLWAEPRYLALSHLMRARILREATAEIAGLGLVLLPAPKGFDLGAGVWKLNPSYMAMQIMRWMANYGKHPFWKRLAESALKISTGLTPKGFVADWLLFDVQKGFLPDLAGSEKGQGGYDAIRVYLWAGLLHADAPEKKLLVKALSPMASYVRDNGYPPEFIDVTTGQASGPGPAGFSAAVLPFLDAVKDTNTLQMQESRLQAKPVRADAYYEQALSLFALGWHEGCYRFAADGSLQPRWKS
jgi:endoglucanase